MTKKNICRLSAALLIALSISTYSCKQTDGHAADAPDHDYSAITEAEEADHEHSGGNEIELPAENAENFGVVTTEIVPGAFSEVVEVSGTIAPSPSDKSTVSARSAGIVTIARGISEGKAVSAGQTIATISARGVAGGDANEAAAIELRAAKRELDRATPLHDDGIISTRDFNEIKRRYEIARAASAGSTGTGTVTTAPTSGVITSLLVNQGQYVEAGEPLATISGNSALVLRADLPEREVGFLNSISGAKIRTSYNDEIIDLASINGKLMSAPSGANASGGYTPVYFSLSNDGRLVNGAFCDVYLLGREKPSVITVPVNAVSEQQGNFFVYVRLSADHYEKRPVKLGHTDGASYEIVSGLHQGDVVVTEGMTYVRLAESSGNIPEGHSHNH